MTPPAGAAGPSTPVVSFELPGHLEAAEPPEVRGRGRADVRLMVVRRRTASITHHGFAAGVADVLGPGDLLVVNTSATVPAAIDARAADGSAFRLHLSTALVGDEWVVEVRRPHGVGSDPWRQGVAGSVLRLAGGGSARLLRPFAGSTTVGPFGQGGDGPAADGQRLWVAALHLGIPVAAYLSAHGQPVRYGHVRRPWPLEAYQTVYATHPGSAEMPSAGRAFTAELITALVARGVGVTPVVLHTGLSSPEAHEPPAPERFRVPPATARWVRTARAAGGAVVAVGTSVVRALETVADGDGQVHPGEGWTELVIGPERGVRAVDGLLTGWHEPEASHLRMLEAVTGRALLRRCYAEALEHGYLWHEFGDLCLLLP